MLQEIAKIIRGISADAVEEAQSGHPGLPLGCAEIGAVLFGEVLKHDPGQPEWPDRDRFVLSAGHGSIFLYTLLYLAGYDISLEDIKAFRKIGSRTPGHPEYRRTPGVEITTGPLGQGFANAVGMALAERMLGEKFNSHEFNIVDHYTYVLVSDGCMMEGITSEAASLAGHLGLGKLIAIYDQNQVSLAGFTEKTFTESVGERFRSYHWQVIENINGHDVDEIRAALMKAREKSRKPTLVITRTHIGYGSPTKQDSHLAHGAPLGQEEVIGLKRNLGLPDNQTFYTGKNIKEFFLMKRKDLEQQRKDWEDRFVRWARRFPEKENQWIQGMNLTIPASLSLNEDNINMDDPMATRNSSGVVLNRVASEIHYLIGGSADLSPSTKTDLKNCAEVQKNHFFARNIRFGVREHAMAAICNGISAHKGFRPYCSTFLVFSDYMRPAIRLAAMMKLPVIFIFTHDSIYVGEDGPTHQPVEHLESLRLIPNLTVIRPADSEEVQQAWKMILKKTDGPIALILSRQKLALLKKEKGLDDFNKGGYIVKDTDSPSEIVITASGSEVSLAVEVSRLLKKGGLDCRIVSVPDRGLFSQQKKEYRKKILGYPDKMQVVIEAATGQGWYELVPGISVAVFVRQFGESGLGEEVAEEAGLNAKKIARQITQYYRKIKSQS